MVAVPLSHWVNPKRATEITSQFENTNPSLSPFGTPLGFYLMIQALGLGLHSVALVKPHSDLRNTSNWFF
jgi:hypothetical protein